MPRMKRKFALEVLYQIGQFFVHERTIGTLALLLSIFVLFRDSKQSQRIDELTFKTNAVQYRPLLKVVGRPKVEEIVIETVPFTLADVQGPNPSVSCSLKFRTKVTVKNEGNALARIVFMVSKDRMSGSADLRAELLTKDPSIKLVPPSENKNFYDTVEIPPGVETSYVTEHTVKAIDNNRFTLHQVIVYSNEMGAVYDTYLWAQYEVSSIKGKITKETTIEDGKEVCNYAPEVPITLENILHFINMNMSFKIYEEQYSRTLLKYVKEERARLAQKPK